MHGRRHADYDPAAGVIPSLFDQPAPHAHGSDTSAEAADSMQHSAGSLRAKVYAALEGSGGMTCDQLEEALGLRHQTCAARLWELERAELIEKSDVKRETRSGRRARVYVVAERKQGAA